jgi:molybdopterin/thiamine biosynthesis adenylyltransferase
MGPAVQADLARLHIGIIGAGSVGAIVAEALARAGIEWITLLDFGTVEVVNLDRLLYASPRESRLARAKVETLAVPATVPLPPNTHRSTRSKSPSLNLLDSPQHWTAACCSAASAGPECLTSYSNGH